MDVAQWGAGSVQELLDLMGHRGAETAGIPRGQQHQADQQHAHQPAAGRHRPQGQAGQTPAATRVVASTMTGWVTSDEAAVAVGATNGSRPMSRVEPRSAMSTGWSPRRTLMKSRNGGLIRPSNTRAIVHQVIASAEASAHQAVKRHHNRFGRWQTSQITAGRHAARLATALTAPINARAIPARPAMTRGEAPQPRNARMTGSRTHGANIIGSVSEEIEPSVVSTRGDSAKAAAPTSREERVPMPRASATRNSPRIPR